MSFSRRGLQCVCSSLFACACSISWAAPKPDLTIKLITLTPPNPRVGDEVLYQAWVRNIGPGGSAGCKCSIKVGGETTPFFMEVPSIAPGVSQVLMRRVRLDRPGRYRVTFAADVDNTINEANETNNQGFLDFDVRASRPDLVLRNAKITPAQPKVGESIRFSADLVNIGEVECPPTSCGTRVGGETNPHLGTYGVIPVDSPTATKYSVSRVMALDKPGNYTVTFIADVNHQVDEANETNNELKLVFTVK